MALTSGESGPGSSTEEVRCRPNGGLWIVVFLFGCLGTLCLTALFWGGPSKWPSLGALGSGLMLSSPFLALSVWNTIYLVKARIIADETGLRWRTTGLWRVASWATVTDYFDEERVLSSGQKTRQGWVQTGAGELSFPTGSWTNEKPLRAFIAAHATDVAAPGWRVVGPGIKDLPMTCHYDTAINRNTMPWLDYIHKIGLPAVVVYFGVFWLTHHRLPGWGWLLTPTGLFVVAKQILPLFIRATYRETRRRLGWTVTATRDGLGFADPSGAVFLPWADITDFYTEGMRSVVVTPACERDFLPTLTGYERLKVIIPQLAAASGRTAWRTGTVRRLPETEGEATRFLYHYRSWDNCGKLWGGTLAAAFAGLVAAGPALIAWRGGAAPSPPEMALAAGSGLLALAVAWLWGQYWAGGIRTDSRGITRCGWPGARFLPWDGVRGLRWRGVSDLVWVRVEGRAGHLSFWKGLGDADRLTAEIAARVGEGTPTGPGWSASPARRETF